MEIQEIKTSLPLSTVLAHYGLKPDKHLRLHCPFHEDKTPSLQIYYKTDTVYCFSANCTTQGKSLDQIDFIMQMDKCNKAEAIQKAKALIGATSPKSVKIADNNHPVTENLTRIAVLSKLMQESRQSLSRSGKGQAYCKERGLDYAKQEIGFLEERYHRSWNENLKQNALSIGLLKEQSNKTLSPHFRNCLIFPLKNREGQIVSIYGRSIRESTEAGQARHFYLKGKHQGLYPKYPAPHTKKLILTESIIDAATLLQTEVKGYEIVACYGTNGLTLEHILREFMTAQKISKFVTESDPKTGAFKQVHLQAEGPVCIAGATTKDKIYEDNSNRSFLIHVNESKSHQEAVLDYQNKQAAGLVNKEVIDYTAQKVHNLQRMLNPSLKVVNPFQPFLKLPEYVFKKLRTNTHYITLIQSITFLHQYQREVKQSQSGQKYIETTLEDVELANALSKESLLRKSDELSGSVREFFEALKYTVRQSQKEAFTAKAIREQFRMHPIRFNRRIHELKNRGYLKQTGGNQKLGYEYQIVTWDDYKVLQNALTIMDDTLAELWQKYPDGKFNRSLS